MKSKFASILGVFGLVILTFIIKDPLDLATLFFYVLLVFFVSSALVSRDLTLITIWNVAFFAIILTEAFTTANVVTLNGDTALRYLIIANLLVFTGYATGSTQTTIDGKKWRLRAMNFVPLFGLILLVILYVSLTLPQALLAFTLGRSYALSNEERNFLGDAAISSLGYILPSILAFVMIKAYKFKIIWPFLISLPIFTILVMNGTRFPLLFSLVGFVLTVSSMQSIQRSTIKWVITLGITGFFLVSITAYMKEFRSVSSISKSTTANNFTSVPQQVAGALGHEGVIDMTTLLINHFEDNDHLFGASSSFLLYFWIPRAFWEDKPTMLGYWLVRKYRGGFSEAHSVSFGFTGELYSDFGYASLIFLFMLGRVLRKAENFRRAAFQEKGYSVILAAMLYPYVFFFVRSPITATINFAGILAIYLIIRRVILKRI